jgi:hypothetical protein
MQELWQHFQTLEVVQVKHNKPMAAQKMQNTHKQHKAFRQHQKDTDIEYTTAKLHTMTEVVEDKNQP